MSYVNQVSKNNTTYDIQDSRVFVLDLGDITSIATESGFQKAIAGADLMSLVNAEIGIVKFDMDDMTAECKVVAKGGDADQGYQVMASLFMQTESNAYTTYIVQCAGNTQSATAMGMYYNQEIGGGSGGSVPFFSASLSEWQEASDGTEVAEFSLDSEDWDVIANNDVAFVKLLDYNDRDTYILPKCSKTYEGGSDMFLFSALIEQELVMAMIQRGDDGDGGYIYVGMAMKGEISSLIEQTTQLYMHTITGTTTGGTGTFTIKLVNTEESSYSSISSVISSIRTYFDFGTIDTNNGSPQAILFAENTNIYYFDTTMSTISYEDTTSWTFTNDNVNKLEDALK